MRVAKISTDSGTLRISVYEEDIKKCIMRLA